MFALATPMRGKVKAMFVPIILVTLVLVPTLRVRVGATEASLPAPVATTHYRTTMIDGGNMFYREAGPADAPVVVLLLGFPTSSSMFRNLITLLADRHHVIAPDYPGFGQSPICPRRSCIFLTRVILPRKTSWT